MAKNERSTNEGAEENGLQFRISEVSTLLKVSPSTLRQWENAGLAAPGRTRSGYRTYSSPQLERLKLIQNLRYEKGLNLEAIRQALNSVDGRRRKDKKKTSAIEKQLPIGLKLRQLRRRRNLTLAKAARAAQVSASFLSSLERGRVHASVSTLQRLAVFYNTTVLAFFGSEKKVGKLVRPAERKKLSNEPGVVIELLALGERAMEPHLFRLAPGATSGESYYHQGEEFIFVISGSCEIWLDDVEHYCLKPGDCLYFSSSQRHRWINPSGVEAVLLWVNTPPTF
jgi:DNA-binding transcriptional MerR regulator/mannose-6-phosphate isomerase-like protein (cupin superfamily)